MRKIIATGALTAAALGLTAGAASASTGADADATNVENTNTNTVNQYHEQGSHSLINVSDVLTDGIANDLLAGSAVANGVSVDADVL